MNYSDFKKMYFGKPKSPTEEEKFNSIYEKVIDLSEVEKVKIKSFLKRDIEYYNHMEKGIGVLSILLTLIIKFIDINSIADYKLALYAMLLVCVIYFFWCALRKRTDYVYLLSIIESLSNN
ncbi:hypothetical protein LAD12857_00570 [Lacrimispora amygdalina]|uniref:Uncharacterized protein n=1 Tax=Lacrimispora amygdalina TaxID=253257 RepID=A0ABQ5LZE0_9FIRM